jgi:hypothetical protein
MTGGSFVSSSPCRRPHPARRSSSPLRSYGAFRRPPPHGESRLPPRRGLTSPNDLILSASISSPPPCRIPQGRPAPIHLPPSGLNTGPQSLYLRLLPAPPPQPLLPRLPHGHLRQGMASTPEPSPLGLPHRVRRRRLFRAGAPPAPARRPTAPARDATIRWTLLPQLKKGKKGAGNGSGRKNGGISLPLSTVGFLPSNCLHGFFFPVDFISTSRSIFVSPGKNPPPTEP